MPLCQQILRRVLQRLLRKRRLLYDKSRSISVQACALHLRLAPRHPPRVRRRRTPAVVLQAAYSPQVNPKTGSIMKAPHSSCKAKNLTTKELRCPRSRGIILSVNGERRSIWMPSLLCHLYVSSGPLALPHYCELWTLCCTG